MKRDSVLVPVAFLSATLVGCSDGGDDAPAADPGTPKESATATAGSPPGVTVGKGDPAKGLPGCTAESCAYIAVTTAGFDGEVTCRVDDAFGGTAGFVTWTQGPDETKQSPNYYGYPAPDGWVDISCGGVRSPRFDW